MNCGGSNHVDGGGHGVGFILIRQVSDVSRVQVCDVVHILLPRQRRQRVSQRVEPLADVGVHVNVDSTHFPEHVESPGASTAALCVQEIKGR